MSLADLKTVHANAREVNDRMKGMSNALHDGAIDIPGILAQLIWAFATISSQLESFATHAIAESESNK